ncbi:uncharacterized protein LOC111618163 isoform X2 [Centruroides sculpturatus]|uniref:uncharacterized protein LOC111618163 isoform X2 n=1 Tax=Centruroides sculpturatus TaxID=218467 RepID=UPI000C6E7E71|nr:uncharacterized protein LOC111618163 isoform X2 [Centruroides sculpturatus]
MILSIGGIAYGLLLAALFVLILQKEFEELNYEMSTIRRSDRNLKMKLQNSMIRHQELWIYMNQLNTKFELAFVLAYFGIIWGTSFLYYAYLYIDMPWIFRIWVLALMIVFSFICIICGCLLCCIAFTMQNGFQDVRQFAICHLELERKLKILNFMKRFGKVSLCLTIGGFFCVNKRIPQKMATTLHSVFSGLLKLKNESRIRRSCQIFTNISHSNENG